MIILKQILNTRDIRGWTGISQVSTTCEVVMNSLSQLRVSFRRFSLLLLPSADNNANSSGVCSHGRSWGIFLEILTSKHCQFLGFSCPGLRDFQRDFLHGNCFRSCDEDTSACGVMGQVGRARGSLYLVTRPTSPYCGKWE